MTWVLASMAWVLVDGARLTASGQHRAGAEPTAVTSPTDPPDEGLSGIAPSARRQVTEGSGVEEPDGRPWRPTLHLGRVLVVAFTGRLERDLRAASPAMGLMRPTSYWQDRRIGIEGTAFKRLAFEVSRDVGQDVEQRADLSDARAWRDVYVDARLSTMWRVEVGQFKVPFSHEELLGEPQRDFVHRSRVARVIAPGRDPGLMVHGRIGGRRLEYQAGYFTRDGDNGRSSQTRGGRRARAVRVVVRPVPRSRPLLASLDVGFALVDSRLDEQLGLRGQTVFGDTVFFDRVTANGRRRRAGADVAWSRGPFGAAAEYAVVSEERSRLGFDSEDLTPLRASAWYVAASWVVTGERKRGRVQPSHSLGRGGPGAVEVVARIEALHFSDAPIPTAGVGFQGAAPGRANADHITTVGLNWYVNGYLKLQTNVVRESLDDPQRSPAASAGGHVTSVVARLQVRL